jgi:hypothetical protein
MVRVSKQGENMQGRCCIAGRTDDVYESQAQRSESG